MNVAYGSIDADNAALRAARFLTLLSIPLGVIATAIGLLLPGFYRATPLWALQARAQDLVTLVVAIPVLSISVYLVGRGSVRGYLVWMGTVGYLIYSYAIYAFALEFNFLFLLYVAILGLSIYSLALGLGAVDPRAIARSFGDATPTRLIGGFLVGVCTLVALLWLADDIPASINGNLPTSLAGIGLLTNPVHVLDLGIVLPGGILTGLLLLRRRPWGFLLSGYFLVKFVALGIGIQAINAFSVAAGQPVDLVPTLLFAAVTVLSIVLAWIYLTSIHQRIEVVARGSIGGSTEILATFEPPTVGNHRR